MSGGHPVTAVDSGRQPVWFIAPENEHEAAFYRNTTIDAFLEPPSSSGHGARRQGESDPVGAFWAQVMRLRDLLKFEFYFADSASFREHILEEMSWPRTTVSSSWPRAARPSTRCCGPNGRSSPGHAAAVPGGPTNWSPTCCVARRPTSVKDLTKRALGVGRQYVAQGRIRSNESVSALLFTTARQVVADQKLLEAAPDLEERRTAFLAKLAGDPGGHGDRRLDRLDQVRRPRVASGASPRRRSRRVTRAG